jgi:hypothetical protein
MVLEPMNWMFAEDPIQEKIQWVKLSMSCSWIGKKMKMILIDLATIPVLYSLTEMGSSI